MPRVRVAKGAGEDAGTRQAEVGRGRQRVSCALVVSWWCMYGLSARVHLSAQSANESLNSLSSSHGAPGRWQQQYGGSWQHACTQWKRGAERGAICCCGLGGGQEHVSSYSMGDQVS